MRLEGDKLSKKESMTYWQLARALHLLGSSFAVGATSYLRSHYYPCCSLVHVVPHSAGMVRDE
jgi:hypothetical protein